jgi:hypothetical protein
VNIGKYPIGTDFRTRYSTKKKDYNVAKIRGIE